VTFRAIVVAILLSIISVAWIHQASLVQTPGLKYAPVYLCSVPPVPALMFLVLLIGLRTVLGRWGRRPLLARIGLGRSFTRKELLVIYAFLVLAVPPVTFGIIELLLPYVTAPVYFSTPQQPTADLAAELPEWFYPHDTEVIRTMYEGSDNGAVPWKAWLMPLGVWTIFLTLLFGTGLCLVSLFRKQWSEYERLRYPLLFIPLDLTVERGESDTRRAMGGFFRNPLVWIAIAIVALHHAANIANAYNPAIMALKDRYRLGPIFTEEPWTPFRRLVFFHRPEMIGFGYFVSLEVLFSVWFFHLMDPFVQSIALMFGYRASPGWPYIQQQGVGAFVMLLIVLTWTARGHLMRVVRAAFRPGPSKGFDDEAIPPRWAVFGSLGGFAAVVAWAQHTGMSVLPALAFFGMLIAFGLVYSRIRAETGVPTMWAYPFDQARNTMHFALGGRGLTPRGALGNLVGLSGFSWLGRGYFMSLMGYQLENEKLAEEGNLSRYGMSALIVGAFLVGMTLGYFFNLRSYYAFGANVLHGGTTGGGYNVQMATREWSQAYAAVRTPGPPNWSRVGGSIGGAVLTLLLVLARFQFLRSPLHPLGYAMALNYGYCLWGPFLAVWVIKAIIHRLGGARAFRRGMPFFLGLAFGDLFIGGLSWIAMAIFGPEVFNGYMVQFG